MKKSGWILIIVLLGFILMAGVFFIFSTRISRPETINLIESSHAVSEDSIPKHHVLHIIILSDSTVYGYTNDLNKGQNLSLYPDNQLRSFIQEWEKEWKDSIFITIKPTSASTYKSTIVVLDEMTINEIQRFAMLDPTEEEKNKFAIKAAEDVLRPVTITTPVSVANEPLVDIPGTLVIELGKNQTIKMNLVQADRKHQSIKVQDMSAGNIIAAISHVKNSVTKDSLRIVIKADPDLKYGDFKNVIEALRKHEIYKYQLITTKE